MGNAKPTSIIPSTSKKLIIEKTPHQWIKQRRGPGGMTLSYVETGYVIQKLNEIFSYNWTFELTDQTIGKKQVYVKGKLTGRFPNPVNGDMVEIIKEQYGGCDIKFLRGSTDTVSIADDLKAAGSDALKKCASMFGIAQDVFWPSGSEYTEHEVDEVDLESITEEQRKMVFALLDAKGKTKLDLDNYINAAFKKMSIQQLTKPEGILLIEKLQTLPEPEDDDVDVNEVDQALGQKVAF